MIRYKIKSRTSITINNAVQGETLETKIDRIVHNNEPIKDGAPLIYTERKEGIRPSTNIRTDRFEIAIDASDKIAKSYMARRENPSGKIVPIDKNKEDVGEPKSIQGKAE